MPIKILRHSLPSIGRAKIGQPRPRKNGKMQPPEKWDHLELTSLERDGDGALTPDVPLMLKLIENDAPTCGGCARSKHLAAAWSVDLERGLPTGFPVVLLYNKLELNLDHALAYYRGRMRYCTGDGETAERLQITGGTEAKPEYGPAVPFGPCGGECPDFQSRRCTPKGTFVFMLREQQKLGTCYQFRTTSWNSLANLQETLGFIGSLTGSLAALRLTFSVHAQTVQPKSGAPANEQMIARLEYEGDIDQLIRQVHDRLQLQAPMISEIRKLEADLQSGAIATTWEPAPDDLDEYRAEFDPQNVAAEEEREEAGEGKASSEAPPSSEAGPSSAGPPEDEPEQAAAAADAPSEELLPERPTPEQKKDLWRACQKRAERLRVIGVRDATGQAILEQTLKALGHETSDELTLDDYGQAFSMASNAKLEADPGK